MIRDRELERLISYAKGMGVSVRFKIRPKGYEADAEWLLDGSEIIIYTTNSTTKIEKVLSLIHELGHHKGFILKGRKVDLEESSNYEEQKKSKRKIEYDYEIADSQHWEGIYRDTDCKFPIWRLHAEIDFQIWAYKSFYETGEFYSSKKNKEKIRELRKKHRND